MLISSPLSPRAGKREQRVRRSARPQVLQGVLTDLASPGAVPRRLCRLLPGRGCTAGLWGAPPPCPCALRGRETGSLPVAEPRWSPGAGAAPLPPWGGGGGAAASSGVSRRTPQVALENNALPFVFVGFFTLFFFFFLGKALWFFVASDFYLVAAEFERCVTILLRSCKVLLTW